MALTNDFKVKNGLTVIDSISAGGNLSASEGFFDGDVGIGTNNPSAKLHVDDNASTGTGLLVTGGGSGGPIATFRRDVGNTGSEIYINAGGSDPQIVFKRNTDYYSIGADASENKFKISDNSALGTNDRFTIDGSGNVGIGTTAPDNKLTVSGAISATGNISTTGNILSAGVNIDQLFGTSGGGDITAVTTGPYLTGGGASGSVEVGIDSACAAAWDAAVAGDISAVVAGTGLTGGGNSGSVTLNISAGDGVQATANCVSVDSTVIRTTGTQTIGGAKTFTSNACFSTGSASAPGITFSDDTTTGLTRSGSTLCLVQGGASRAHVTSAGIFSQANVYSSSGSSFRNFSGRWNGTTGTTGCGFRFENTVDGVTLDISSTGDTCVYGSLSAQDEVIGECIVKRGGTSSQFLKADGSVDSTSYGTGDITAVTAGTGLTGGGTSGSVTLNLSAGDGVQATANCVSVDSTVIRTTGGQTIDNTLVISSGTSGDANLCIVSDTDNNNENDTGCILFVQDGGATQAAIGQNGATSQYTGALANAAYFGSIGNNPVQFIQSDTARLTIENGGNVGIGITNPTYKFQVTSADASDDVAYIHHDNASQSSGTVLKVRSDAGDSSGYSLLDVQNNTGNALYVGGNRSVGIGTTSPSVPLDVVGTIKTTTSFVGDNAIVNKITAATTSGDIQFRNNNGSTKVTIKDAGNVGIGTTSPATKLHVAGNSLVTGDSTIYGNLSVTGDFTCLETTISTTSALSVTNTGTGPALFVCQAGVQPIAHFIDANGDDIVFADDGKVGIGTFNPAEELTVSGTISASEFVYVGEKKAVSSDDINFIVKVTQAEYDALTPDSGTLYIITDENTNSPVINPITTVTANYTVTDEDHTILTNGSSVLNVGLPSAVTNSNYVYNVKNVSTNAITISAAAGNIDGQSSQAICQQFENITVQSDGSNWFII